MKKHLFKRIFAAVIAAAVLPVLSGCEYIDALIQPESAVSQIDAQGFSVDFIDIGQGDSELLICDGEAMLIDGGPGSSADVLMQYLRSRGISSLKYVVATHPHEDHIGGLDDVISAFSVGDVIMPEATSNTMAFERLLDAIEQKKLEITVPETGDTFSLGSAVITVVSPTSEKYSDLNDCSIVMRAVYRKASVLFMGDSGKASNDAMMKSGVTLKSDVYKVSHHGSSSNNLSNFLKAVSPEYAVISCGAGNSYGHPHSETLSRLETIGAKVFRTDLNGTVIMTVTDDKTEFRTQK